MAQSFNVELHPTHAVARHDLFISGRVGSRSGHAAWNRVVDGLGRLIDGIADAKVRRMLRELELRGIYYDRANEAWDPGSRRRRIGGS